MTRTEAQTRRDLIDPALAHAGWDEARIEREYPIRPGRVRLFGDEAIRDEPEFADYVLRHEPNGHALATLEAKDEGHGRGAGLQQALAYATSLGVRFAYSSNGHGFMEQDRQTAIVRELETIPGPDELIERWADSTSMRGPMVTNRRGATVSNPLIEPLRVVPGAHRLRHYQEGAVTAAIEQILGGRRRALLALATGTGKTFIASSISWKLMQSGYVKKILFLVDRVSLWKQAYNDFAVIGDARGLVTSNDLPIHRDIHFATYQTLYTETPEGRIYERYDPDFFDLVIVDECHRSGYGDWRGILDHFADAFHLGLTATPKRTDSIDTYEFFASENRDETGQPRPAYEYSLAQGIEDGYLATYRVHRVITNVDADGIRIEDEVERGADLFVPEDTTVRDVYQQAQFEREIVIPDRTRALCEDLANKLRSWGVNDKTIVYCVTVEHADEVRRHLQTMLGPDTGKNLYAVRIVSEERDAQLLLEAFQRRRSSEPVVATTVDLLTTGVDIPAVKNIVFMKPVASPTPFKQIIGRGSRIDDDSGKLFFRILDYTNATRLFDTWDTPQDGGTPLVAGHGELRGTVVHQNAGTPITAARVTVLLGPNRRQETTATTDGGFVLTDLPEQPIPVVATARGFRRLRIQLTPQPPPVEPVTLSLAPVAESRDPVRISGVEVSIRDETVLTLEASGRQLSITEYIDFAGERIRVIADGAPTLAELWRDPESRSRFREQLRTQSVDPALLALVLGRPDADEFDLIAYAGFGRRVRTREERARQLEQFDAPFLAQFDERQRDVVEHLLDKYRIGGVEELGSSKVFQLPPFDDEFGGVRGLTELFGGPSGVAELLQALQHHLYPAEDVA